MWVRIFYRSILVNLFLLLSLSFFGQNSGTSLAQDTDGDGVLDSIDPDDDNDGVFDVNERILCLPKFKFNDINQYDQVDSEFKDDYKFSDSSGVSPVPENLKVFTNVLLQDGSVKLSMRTLNSTKQAGKYVFGLAFFPSGEFIFVNETRPQNGSNYDTLEVLLESSIPLDWDLAWLTEVIRKNNKPETAEKRGFLGKKNNVDQEQYFMESDLDSRIHYSPRSTLFNDDLIPNDNLLVIGTTELGNLNLIDSNELKKMQIRVYGSKTFKIKAVIRRSMNLGSSGFKIKVGICPEDFDGDGFFDHLDMDSDNDGIPDIVEAQDIANFTQNVSNINEYPNGLSPVKTNGTDRDLLNLDSDDDGIFDIVESGLGVIDVNKDGKADGNVGINGLINSQETQDSYQPSFGVVSDPSNQIAKDGYGNFKFRAANAVTANDDNFYFIPNSPLIFYPLKNDFSENGKRIVINKTIPGSVPGLSVLMDSVSFQYLGTATTQFQYEVCVFDKLNNPGQCQIATITLTPSDFLLNNDTVCVSVKTGVDKDILRNDVYPTDVAGFVFEIITQPKHGTLEETRVGKKWFTTYSYNGGGDRAVDSLVYRVTNTQNVSQIATVYFNLNTFGLIKSAEAICASKFRVFLNEVWAPGYWFSNTSEITVDSPRVSSSTMNLKKGIDKSKVVWIDEGGGCGSLAINIERNLASVSWLHDGENTLEFCSNDGNLDLNAYITGNKDGTWRLDGVSVVPGPTIVDLSRLASGDFGIRYEVSNPSCNYELNDTFSLKEVNASFDLNDFICLPSDSIFFNNLAPIRVDQTSKWYINNILQTSKGFNPSIYSNSSFIIKREVINGSCLDLIDKVVNVYDQNSAVWNKFNDTICSNDTIKKLSEIAKGGTWFLDNSEIDPNTFVQKLATGNYTLKRVANNQNCPSQDSLDFRVIKLDSLYFKNFVTDICPEIRSINLDSLKPSLLGGIWKINNANTQDNVMRWSSVDSIPKTVQYEVTVENICKSKIDTILSLAEEIVIDDISLSECDSKEKKWLFNNSSAYKLQNTDGDILYSFSNDTISFKSLNFSPHQLEFLQIENDFLCPNKKRFFLSFVEKIVAVDPIEDFSTDQSYLDLKCDISNLGYDILWKVEEGDANLVDSTKKEAGLYINSLNPVKMSLSLNSSVCPSFTDFFTITPLKVRISEGVSPNGDDKNDNFAIIGLHSEEKAELYIMNRWGQIIFESFDYQNDWPKLISLNEVIEDEFFYYIKTTKGRQFEGSFVLKK